MASRGFSYGSTEIYEDNVLGVGSYGKVYRAKCGQLPCAAKLLHDTFFQDNDPGTNNLARRFEQECQFLSNIKHPNIVQYLGTEKDPKSHRPVLLMELMDESLTRFLERSTLGLPYHSQLNICHDVALALAYLHSNTIIHRDLSSNNVLLIGEGSRAKVTDFGMSRLTEMNPHMIQLTQCPGTPVYMSPEALITPPHYSSKLDIFSHGVLTIQIITRNFPNPGDANRYMHDPKFPGGRALIQIPESNRRKKDIDLIEADHALLPTVLHCIKDIDTERPSADELCEGLASLKSSAKYRDSVEQTGQQTSSAKLEQMIYESQKEYKKKEQECHDLEKKAQDLQKELEHSELQKKDLQKELKHSELQKKDLQKELEHSELQKKDLQKELEHCELLKKDVQKELEYSEQKELDSELQKKDFQEKILKKCQEQQFVSKEGRMQRERSKRVRTIVRSAKVKTPSLTPTWRQGEPVPEKISSLYGAAVVHGNTAYFSQGYCVYSYAPHEDKWTNQQCKYKDFSLAVVNDKLTTIGGCSSDGTPTNSLLSLTRAGIWGKLLPPMPTQRILPAAVTTSTHLVVAGGKNISEDELSTVEVMDIGTLQWSTANNLPQDIGYPRMTYCDGYLYISKGNIIFSCYINTSNNYSWTRQADIPVRSGSTLVMLGGRVFAIGGYNDQPTGAIHCYDKTTDSWSLTGTMPTPREYPLVAVLPSNELIVVGGSFGTDKFNTNEIGGLMGKVNLARHTC